MVYNFVRGGAAINVLSKAIGAELIVADLGVAEDIFSDRVIIKKLDMEQITSARDPQ